MIRPYNRAALEFRLGQEIGQEGRNSQVFVAEDPQLGAELVIKRMHKNQFSDRDEYYRESSIVYMGGHPNVVPILYACEDDDHVYLAMPHYRNGSLSSLMGTRFLTVREIVRFGTQILSGLHHIHSKGLIHFDVKPDNVLISERGEAHLSDFGLARQTTYGGVAEQDRFYPKIVPPEVYNTDRFTNTIDIYEMGITLYRMCVGHNRFDEQFQVFRTAGRHDRHAFRTAVVNGRFPDRNDFPEHIPTKLRNVITKCLDLRPENRFQTAIEVVNAMADIDDEYLDWYYEVRPDGSRAWCKVDGEHEYRLVINSNGSSMATKTVGNGTPRRVTDYCKERLTTQETRRFLRTT